MLSRSRTTLMNSRNSLNSSSPLPSASNSLKNRSNSSFFKLFPINVKHSQSSSAWSLPEASASRESNAHRMSRSCAVLNSMASAWASSSSKRTRLSLSSTFWQKSWNSENSIWPEPFSSAPLMRAASSSCSTRLRGVSRSCSSRGAISRTDSVPSPSLSYFEKRNLWTPTFKSFPLSRIWPMIAKNSRKSTLAIVLRSRRSSMAQGVTPNSLTALMISAWSNFPEPSASYCENIACNQIKSVRNLAKVAPSRPSLSASARSRSRCRRSEPSAMRTMAWRNSSKGTPRSSCPCWKKWRASSPMSRAISAHRMAEMQSASASFEVFLRYFRRSSLLRTSSIVRRASGTSPATNSKRSTSSLFSDSHWSTTCRIAYRSSALNPFKPTSFRHGTSSAPSRTPSTSKSQLLKARR
mmetsp:Transcript_43774/g.117666  ORF Transcript_43774/g.117666 Transcript_43774/m.117666 type:complete len:410 (-) Transcript_43774:129-1358(-)